MSLKVKLTSLILAGTISLLTTVSASAQEANMVQINPGDTLEAIATAHDTTYVRIFNANPHIANPDLINAGDSVRIPAESEELPDRFGEIQAQIAAAQVAAQAQYAQQVSYTQQPEAVYQNAQPAAAPVTDVDGGVWDTIAQCESGGNWNINTGNGYTGGLQFAHGTWAAYGDGSPTAAHASKEAQIAAAEKVLAAQGWGAWPACSSKAGLR
ncbi:LysM peptidoglycan-binding domain-containing protein [Candidatus Saccharibacteria bacterium]|jgi:LysM repeat protein|nr:LysM peptidoglycan-binding domain-containing protein [Candidatus Saccharibacteria bacterium]